MKICISSTGPNLDSPVDPRFGRCAFFLIGESEGENFEAVPNQGAAYGRGAGISAAQMVASAGVQIVLTGNVGPNAFMALNSAGIKIYPGAFGMTARQALLAFREGKLQETGQPTGPGFMGMPGGMPPGGGMGRGRGMGGGRGMGRGGGIGMGMGPAMPPPQEPPSPPPSGQDYDGGERNDRGRN